MSDSADGDADPYHSQTTIVIQKKCHRTAGTRFKTGSSAIHKMSSQTGTFVIEKIGIVAP